MGIHANQHPLQKLGHLLLVRSAPHSREERRRCQAKVKSSGIGRVGAGSHWTAYVDLGRMAVQGTYSSETPWMERRYCSSCDSLRLAMLEKNLPSSSDDPNNIA